MTSAMPMAAPTPPAPPTPPSPGDQGDAGEGVEVEEDDSIARITLRIPESLKYKAEELAAKGGHSLNSWIVNVLRAATRDRAVEVDIDLSSFPFGSGPGAAVRSRGTKRMTGWV